VCYNRAAVTVCAAPLHSTERIGLPMRIYSTTPLENRFWSKVDKTGDCWEWQGGHVKGYGEITAGKRPGRTWRYAHRVAWELTFGPIPRGLCVLHRCDNRGCVRPAHLFLGTVADNNRDMWAKGRGRGRGPTSRFSRQFVETLVSLHNQGLSTRKIAARLGNISDSHVHLLLMKEGIHGSTRSSSPMARPSAQARRSLRL
jgi:hypothetical protein